MMRRMCLLWLIDQQGAALECLINQWDESCAVLPKAHTQK